ncbi:MAG TPA: hypothetical protein PK019_01675 [Sedimentisphaerales bacterium]|nr:hypothetical protein [Sedimentisphaerales bacterium]
MKPIVIRSLGATAPADPIADGGTKYGMTPAPAMVAAPLRN